MSAVDIKEIEKFFFEAMVRGWAGNGKYIEIPGREGYKRFVFSDGDFHLCDEYCVNKESKKSFGTTTIWFRDTPVWVMTYGGWYEYWAVELVKKALLETYQKRIFMGGRGPSGLYLYGAYYINRVEGRNDFSIFSGYEECKKHDDKFGGCHRYWGMILI